jgi:hypothetical protein
MINPQIADDKDLVTPILLSSIVFTILNMQAMDLRLPLLHLLPLAAWTISLGLSMSHEKRLAVYLGFLGVGPALLLIVKHANVFENAPYLLIGSMWILASLLFCLCLPLRTVGIFRSVLAGAVMILSSFVPMFVSIR